MGSLMQEMTEGNKFLLGHGSCAISCNGAQRTRCFIINLHSSIGLLNTYLGVAWERYEKL